MKMPLFLHRLTTAKYFYPFAGKLIPWLATATALLLIGGTIWGLGVAPADYQQGESYRIMFVHVPSAWTSMFVYMAMATAALISLVWKIKIMDSFAAASAPIGAWFTFLALATGAIWGKPMWGTWWVWDARLTSELILLFIYLGVIALRSSIDEPTRAARACALLTIVGVINIPIIHYSVDWWNTLHQPASVSKFDAPSVHISMLIPLLMMAMAFTFYYLTMVLVQMRSHIVQRNLNARWLKEILVK